MYDYYDRPTGTEEFIVSSADSQDYYVFTNGTAKLDHEYYAIKCMGGRQNHEY